MTALLIASAAFLPALVGMGLAMFGTAEKTA